MKLEGIRFSGTPYRTRPGRIGSQPFPIDLTGNHQLHSHHQQGLNVDPRLLHVIDASAHYGVVQATEVPKNDEEEIKKDPNPLFRFGVPSDMVSDLINVKDHIYIKIFSNLIEGIVQENTSESDIRFFAWLLIQGAGPLMVNNATPDDPKKLVHVLDISKNSHLSDVASAIKKNLYTYPVHFVLRSDFKVKGTIFASKLLNEHSIRRMYKEVNTPEQVARMV